MTNQAYNLSDLVRSTAERSPDHPAILGLSQSPLSYSKLGGQIETVVSFLNSHNIGRNDPVAIVLKNGPNMATTFLSIASGATSTPLNPNYTASEYAFYLEDLQAKAVVVEKESANPVIDVAAEMGIPIIHLATHDSSPAGSFTLSTAIPETPCAHGGMARPSDTALILHTSGTTSRPKMVPLTHKNLTTSAVNIQRTLELRPNDLCLNIMPLFHIHGLVAAVLGTIASGGSIVCTPGFYVNYFFDWLTQFQPTWYTAVPTMHQAILNKAQTQFEAIQQHTLRFIRSSSASLPPAVMTEIEQTFGVPVIEAYGMTEASHQMASNPLPPAKRKPGSVGLPAGPEIAIMDESYSKILPKHTPGEIVIRGENVTLGYLNNPDANQKAYTDGWFRTGDQGYLDEEGYLIITGRIKEIINRGGEKISPREVDEVLLDHPAVSQAVTFGIPDLALGEAVGAAVVLKDKRVDESELKQYAAGKLSIHKVPSRILIMDEIPKGPTGKLQRIGLAEKLGLTGKIPNSTGKSFGFIALRNELEEAISKIWQEILGIAQVGVRQSFRDVGGDSMLATLVHQELETQFGIQISLIVLMDAPDIESQAALVSSLLNQNSA